MLNRDTSVLQKFKSVFPSDFFSALSYEHFNNRLLGEVIRRLQTGCKIGKKYGDRAPF